MGAADAPASPAGDRYLAERLADWADRLDGGALPTAVAATSRRLLLDVTGLCVAARDRDYVRAALDGCVDLCDAAEGSPANNDHNGHNGHNGHNHTADSAYAHAVVRSLLIGHRRLLDPCGAALVNGTAAHGEDFDDTFEGTPVHVGAVLVPALLALAHRYRDGGRDLVRGLAAGGELMCRMALVSPTAIHRAGFHPTAVIGALGAALAVATALRLPPQATASALGVAGSLAAGIIEYLAEGAWTKRLHAGWAAQSGVRAALLARAGFVGPRSVLEGRHGFFHAFTNGDIEPDYTPLRVLPGPNAAPHAGAAGDWRFARLAFKPYPCGTMIQPFVDCALQLHRRGIAPAQIAGIVADVGEGTVHRLWEPLTEKRRPSSPYSAKFSVPYCIAAALHDGRLGLAQFGRTRVADAALHELAGRIDYRIDPADEYPRNYSGRLRVRLRDGGELVVEQPHLRGGVREPLSDAELEAKFLANAAAGGWSPQRAEACHRGLTRLPDRATLDDLSFLRG